MSVLLSKNTSIAEVPGQVLEFKSPARLSDDERELRRILDGDVLTPVFQPIISLVDAQIIGYEALIRGPEKSRLQMPDTLFAVARDARLLAKLEYACRQVSCEQFVALDLPGKLFLNMSPIAFTASQYRGGVTRKILQRVGLSAERIVFELTESQPLDEIELLRAASAHFQRQGFAVALDDLGAGYAGLRVWSELCPDYVKIDRHFISGIDQDPVKREFVSAILAIAHRIGHRAIAEGIETASELRTLIDLGVDYAQGYFIARPTANPTRSFPAHIRTLRAEASAQRQLQAAPRVRELLVPVLAVTPETPVAAVAELFAQDAALPCVAVVAAEQALGLVYRGEFLYQYARFGQQSPSLAPLIHTFISPNTLVVELSTALKQLARILSELPEQYSEDFFLVCDQGRYCGLGRVRDLLRRLSE